MKVPAPRKLNSGTWFIQLRIGGKSVPVSASSKSECVKQAQLVKAEYQAGQRIEASDQTLRAAIDAYIASKSNVLSPATLRGYKVVRDNRFSAYMGTKLAKLPCQRMVNDEAAAVSAKTVRNAWGLVASVLKANGLPVPSVTLPQTVRNERPWLDPEQVKVFVAAVKGTEIEVPALLALHGLRRSEVFAVLEQELRPIDLKRGTITVRGAVVPDQKNVLVRKETNKNASSARTVPIMIPELRDAVKRWKPALHGPDWLKNQIDRICAENNLPEVGVHGLRHSFASLCYHLGISEKQCMAWGGWSDHTTMHNIYTHISEKDQSEAQKAVSAFFSA